MSINLLRSISKRSSLLKRGKSNFIGRDISLWQRTLYVSSLQKKNQVGKLLEEPEEDYNERLNYLYGNEGEDYYDESYYGDEDFYSEPVEDKSKNKNVVEPPSGSSRRRYNTFTPELENLKIGTTSVPWSTK
eukprot:TRINITY_DN79_c0_g1_i1.p1 TRINITY_DN79_c0_g1~~TRINITY_DN79_c0_g1_i1.p1  ORF type:complete len:151 (-),score=35.59 TRINITY_DN79_c0_g1_i1:36-431(-)